MKIDQRLINANQARYPDRVLKIPSFRRLWRAMARGRAFRSIGMSFWRIPNWLLSWQSDSPFRTGRKASRARMWWWKCGVGRGPGWIVRVVGRHRRPSIHGLYCWSFHISPKSALRMVRPILPTIHCYYLSPPK